jgi:hypothetical protein
MEIPIGGGVSAPLYLLRFGKDGNLQSPETAKAALRAARTATDVFLFSHGWNNIYEDALAGYCKFADGFIMQRQGLGLKIPPSYQPVLIGVIWPSTSFVLPGEQGPEIAGGTPNGELTERMIVDITENMEPGPAGRLVELLDGVAALDRKQATVAATLVRGALWAEGDAEGASEPPDSAAILSSWDALSETETPYVEEEEQVGTVRTPRDSPGANERDALPDSPGTGDPAAAGSSSFDPRGILRLGSVWLMKGRAGKVGTRGVGPLLAQILERDGSARLHLVGHSFGARVLLSGIASQRTGRKVHSLLLLQAAVNRWCFAGDVAGTGRPGGYIDVPDRVERPILSTLSVHDQPLHEFFHLAVRGDSLGEINIAAIGNTDRYGALGGYGPNGLGAPMARSEPLREPGNNYDLSGPVRVLSLDGSGAFPGAPVISGHGDINNPSTWWAMHCLADRGHG